MAFPEMIWRELMCPIFAYLIAMKPWLKKCQISSEALTINKLHHDEKEHSWSLPILHIHAVDFVKKAHSLYFCKMYCYEHYLILSREYLITSKYYCAIIKTKNNDETWPNICCTFNILKKTIVTGVVTKLNQIPKIHINIW